ncbi:MAG TPA: hypothetical protein VM686_39050 [Polyangiaceae bacterium]|nr:hypothetical protein [Polyangiaceae bacterium]
MTTAPISLTASASDVRGRLLEFMLVGGATFFLFPLAWLLRQVLGLDTAELAVGFLMFHGAHLINDPHFSVTYLLFYKDARRRAFGDAWSPAQRWRYWFAGLVVPLGLALWAGFALRSKSAESMGLLIQLMFLLVGWHYVKQGFGVLSVLSARRGVRFDSRERRVILAHCFVGWAYAWASPADPGKVVEESGVVFSMLPHPLWLERLTQAAFWSSALVLGAVLFAKWRRERRLPPLAPLSALLVSVWLWMVYSSLDPLMVYMIPALHSIQYLYFVWLLRRNEARANEGPPSFGRPAAVQVGILALSAVALGFVLLRGVPALFDGAFGSSADEGGIGATPYFAAIYTFVNIHHYFMDSVIWRRDNPETRHLLAAAD